MKFTVEIEPEEFGEFISAFPAEVRQQFIDSAIKAYPMMFTEMMKSAGVKVPTATEFNPMDPFGFFKAFSGTKK